MKLWLDDIREPWKFGALGWTWVKTCDEAIDLLKTGEVEFASLDHDLSELATLGMADSREKTGYTVICWMEENDCWPVDGVSVHSDNVSGRKKMELAINRYYGRTFRSPRGN